MFYVVSMRGEELASEDSFTKAVFELMDAPKGAEIFNEEGPIGVTSETEAIQLLQRNPYLRVCDAFETVKVSEELGCCLVSAATLIMEQHRLDAVPGEPCTTEQLQYAGTFGVKNLFLTPANKWK